MLSEKQKDEAYEVLHMAFVKNIPLFTDGVTYVQFYVAQVDKDRQLYLSANLRKNAPVEIQNHRERYDCHGIVALEVLYDDIEHYREQLKI